MLIFVTLTKVFLNIKGALYCNSGPRTYTYKQFNTYKPVGGETNNFGFRPGPTQTDLDSHKSMLKP